MSDLVNRAYFFAKAAHEAVGQKRNYTGDPYICLLYTSSVESIRASEMLQCNRYPGLDANEIIRLTSAIGQLRP